MIQTEMTKHHTSRQNQSSWIRLTFASNCSSATVKYGIHTVQPNMTTSRFKYRKFPSNIGSRNNAWSSDKTSTNIRQNTPIQIWYNQNIKLLGSTHSLHGSIVDNQIV